MSMLTPIVEQWNNTIAPNLFLSATAALASQRSGARQAAPSGARQAAPSKTWQSCETNVSHMKCLVLGITCVDATK